LIPITLILTQRLKDAKEKGKIMLKKIPNSVNNLTSPVRTLLYSLKKENNSAYNFHKKEV
jgi:hypothetical protein